MHDLELIDEDSGATVFRDVIMLALAGFITLVVMLLPHLNPPAKVEDGDRTPGNVVVELRWPDHLDADVDLWVQAPGDRPVGYSNKGGAIFNLLRDDLGQAKDVSGLNYESSYSRGVPVGEYTINAHLYRNRARIYPVPIKIVVSVKNAVDAPLRQILSTDLELRREGEEITAFRFRLDAMGRLVSGSVHNLARPLRSRDTS